MYTIRFSLTLDDSFEVITKNEPPKFPRNGFGEKENCRVWSLKGESRQHRFESKRRNNKGGAMTRKAERGTEKNRGHRATKMGRTRKVLRDARNKLQERGIRMANGRDV